ncbi:MULTISPECIES: hypothetical protein [unclassified Bradyrhizobium]|uniref:hypothetical protein n=1 Tax=unclassified Bradyrhizobium TaxID=2631580 RepID=UPI0028EC8D4E|nr:MULTISPECIES: hypothetical protein [unclassified Bradyrhizobium]
MADLKRERLGEGEALLKRLRRLRLRAATVGKDDRAQLLALIDDIETVRRKLLRECALLDEELKVATVRVTALNTYARVAQISRRPQREQ